MIKRCLAETRHTRELCLTSNYLEIVRILAGLDLTSEIKLKTKPTRPTSDSILGTLVALARVILRQQE